MFGLNKIFYENIDIYNKTYFMDLTSKLNNYLGKQGKYSEQSNGDGTKEVCDLETGDCYVVREKDGLIERAGHQTTVNRRVKVETVNGIKQLLNG